MFSPSVSAQFLKKLPSPIYKLGAQFWLDKQWPRHLFIEICAGCNLACDFCPRDQGKDHMPWEIFTQIIDEGSKYGSRSYSLHLFNEPMLSPYWSKAIRYIYKRNRRNKVLLTTNGTAINAKVDELIDSNPDQVFWTWRLEAKFTEETKRKLKQWQRFRVRFIEEVTPKEAYEEWADWPNVEGRHIHSYGGNVDVSKWNVENKKPLRWSCYHLFYAPAIAWNGDILICCADPKRSSVIGTFPKMTLAEAWQGEVMKRLREEQLNGKYSGICSNCDIWKQTPNIFFGHEYPDKTA